MSRWYVPWPIHLFCVMLLSPALAAGSLAIVDVTVVPMKGQAVLPHQTVLIEGERIASLGPVGSLRVPADAQVVDGRHRYLLPGLVDAHVHLWGYSRQGAGSRRAERQILALLLAHGVTTAVVMEGSPDTLALREAVKRGEVRGPRLFTAGPLLQMEHSGELPGRLTFTTPEAVTAEVTREKAAGFDFVKVHGALPPESYEALLRTAKSLGLPVIGHIPDNLGLDPVLAGGQRQITHVESFLQGYFEFNRSLPTDPAEADRMMREVARRTREAGTFVAPTLSVFRQIITQIAELDRLLTRPAMAYLPPESSADWQPGVNPYVRNWTLKDIPQLARQFAFMQRLTRALSEARVPLLMGTDNMVPCQLPGYALEDEFAELHAAGLSPYQILLSATLEPARFLGQEKDLGTVEAGKVADLLLVNADPLENAQHAFCRAGLVRQGQWIPEADLQAAVARGATAWAPAAPPRRSGLQGQP
ncbi:amidohydrolase family protein [Geothrix sp. PMB-07]|uniref:amidohydrolase family protein n=1 Tax=Geothrix sp. PMB-07 TaxID=3068640 RepID=UPI002741209A|nr:amidohydrolase family protein [Geothrix sp. PMB-07]WLT32973.1 amidohydrolase family protein [Geothrix sp. PMB-07]